MATRSGKANKYSGSDTTTAYKSRAKLTRNLLVAFNLFYRPCIMTFGRKLDMFTWSIYIRKSIRRQFCGGGGRGLKGWKIHSCCIRRNCIEIEMRAQKKMSTTITNKYQPESNNTAASSAHHVCVSECERYETRDVWSGENSTASHVLNVYTYVRIHQ